MSDRSLRAMVPMLLSCLLTTAASAADWPRFRGPNGSGIAADGKVPPTEWSNTKNLKWKADLPGPGLSSPIVVGDRVYVTCWTGYGANRDNIGRPDDLKRHLLCIDRKTGKTIWSVAVDAVLPEDPYRGMFTENGYASHTPAADASGVYVFFGKTGVIAFDQNGKERWRKQVGTDSDRRGWGTASSVILYKNMVIVTASIESGSLIALEKESGKEVWRKQANGFDSTWGTPILVDLPDGRTDLVLSVPYEIWGFDPETGKLRWYCESVDSDSICSSVVAHDGVVYAVEGRNGGSVAIKAGGMGDVTKTHVVWSGRERGRIASPIYYEGRLYWVAGKILGCLDAKSGERLYQARLGGGAANAPADAGAGNRRGGRGGGMGGQDYSSPVLAGNTLFYVSRAGEMYVGTIGSEYKPVAVNRFEGDNTDFNGTPAISDGDLFIRSGKALYCVGAE